MSLLCAFGFAFAGYVALCVTSNAQARDFWPEPLTADARIILRICGYVLLALSAWPWMHVQGNAMGFVSWVFCILPLAALPLIFAWPYASRPLAALGVVAVPLSAVLSLFL